MRALTQGLSVCRVGPSWWSRRLGGRWLAILRSPRAAYDGVGAWVPLRGFVSVEGAVFAAVAHGDGAAGSSVVLLPALERNRALASIRPPSLLSARWHPPAGARPLPLYVPRDRFDKRATPAQGGHRCQYRPTDAPLTQEREILQKALTLRLQALSWQSAYTVTVDGTNVIVRKQRAYV